MRRAGAGMLLILQGCWQRHQKRLSEHFVNSAPHLPGNPNGSMQLDLMLLPTQSASLQLPQMMVSRGSGAGATSPKGGRIET